MTRAPSLRKMLWVVLFAWAGASGCIHNHYYGAIPGCPPGTQTVTTQVGPVCEVPADSATVVSGPGTAVVTTPSNQPRVVISQPAYQPTFGDSIAQTVRRFEKWRRPDPEQGVATLRSEGALDDNTIKR